MRRVEEYMEIKEGYLSEALEIGTVIWSGPDPYHGYENCAIVVDKFVKNACYIPVECAKFLESIGLGIFLAKNYSGWPNAVMGGTFRTQYMEITLPPTFYTNDISLNHLQDLE